MSGGRRVVDAADLREAAAWRLLSVLLERPRSGWEEEARSLAGEIADPVLKAAAAAAAGSANEGEYLRCLGPGGAASPREVAYRLDDPGRILSEIANLYQLFSYRPRSEDTLDHVAVESGFLGFLHLKKAFAIASGNEEGSAIAASAMGAFASDHLRHAADPIARRLELARGPQYLLLAMRCLRDRVGRSPWRDDRLGVGDTGHPVWSARAVFGEADGCSGCAAGDGAGS